MITDRDRLRDRLTFYPVAVIGAVFCITILASLASWLGDPADPINQWMSVHGTRLIIWETGLLMAVGLLAMGIDRARTLRQLHVSRSIPQEAEPSGNRDHEGSDVG